MMHTRVIACIESGRSVPVADLSYIRCDFLDDMVVDPHGGIYVGCCFFSPPGKSPLAWSRDDPGPDSIAYVDPDGRSHVVAQGLVAPNGMVVTPDARRLIVSEWRIRRLTAFEIEPGGGLTGREVYADLPAGAWADGICVDADGGLWLSSLPNGIFLRLLDGKIVARSQALGWKMGCVLHIRGEELRFSWLPPPTIPARHRDLWIRVKDSYAPRPSPYPLVVGPPQTASRLRPCALAPTSYSCAITERETSMIGCHCDVCLSIFGLGCRIGKLEDKQVGPVVSRREERSAGARSDPADSPRTEGLASANN